MTVIGVPSSLLKLQNLGVDWPVLIKWLAVYHPEVTADWDRFCDDLRLLPDDDHEPPRWHDRRLLFGSRPPRNTCNTERKYSRQKINRLSKQKTLKTTFEREYPSYDPLCIIYPHPYFACSSSTSTDSEETEDNSSPNMSRRSPNKSPATRTKSRSSNVNEDDIASISKMLQKQDLKGNPLPVHEHADIDPDEYYKLAEGLNKSGQSWTTAVSAQEITRDNAGMIKGCRVTYQLGQNNITPRTQSETSARLVRVRKKGGKVVTCAAVTLPFTFMRAFDALDGVTNQNKKVFGDGGDNFEKNVASALMHEGNEGTLDCYDEVYFELPDSLLTKDDQYFSNEEFNELWNKKTKKFDIQPTDPAYLKTSIKEQEDVAIVYGSKNNPVNLTGCGATVTITVAISGTWKTLTMEDRGEGDDDAEDMYAHLDDDQDGEPMDNEEDAS